MEHVDTKMDRVNTVRPVGKVTTAAKVKYKKIPEIYYYYFFFAFQLSVNVANVIHCDVEQDYKQLV